MQPRLPLRSVAGRRSARPRPRPTADAPGIEPTVANHVVTAMYRALRASGFDPTAHDATRRLMTRLDAQPLGRTRWADVVALWELAEASTGDPGLGLAAARVRVMHPDAIIGQLILTSRTLGEGWRQVIRYQESVCDERVFSLTRQSGRWLLGYGHAMEPPATVQLIEFNVATMAIISRIVAGPKHPAERVLFRHRPLSPADVYFSVFRCPASFGATADGIVLSDATMARRSPFANDVTARAIRDEAERRLREWKGTTWNDRVAAALQGLLATPGCSLDGVATVLGVTTRTLQRRLAAEQVTFDAALDAIRRARALHLVREGTRPAAEIAALLGYADRRAFARAFKRWTGAGVAAYRAARLRPT